MKIFTENSVKVQKKDIIYLRLNTNIPTPTSIFLKVFGHVVIIDETNRHEFVTFTKPTEIEFFRSLDFIIDFNDIKDFSLTQLIELGQNAIDERRRLVLRFNAMKAEEKKQNIHLLQEIKNLEHVINTIKEYYWYVESKMKEQKNDKKPVNPIKKFFLEKIKKELK